MINQKGHSWVHLHST